MKMEDLLYNDPGIKNLNDPNYLKPSAITERQRRIALHRYYPELVRMATV